ncbi:hypothetical protein B296_00053172 [Ensete ventricosum]|uniref:Uncharacterized protein n=1 Tax=Ensete ventricosum TaxID=4639 RepID=A0A426WWV6_ENSVE|nr:hypothetical protein B296_00053172 [Ensete ventricosum]
MVDRLQPWPPPLILLPPSTQELRDHIEGVSLQRSIERSAVASAAAKAPCKGVAGCCQGQPAGATATCGHNHLQRGTRKGGRLQGARKERSPMANPQGVVPAARAVANKGNSAGHKSDCRLARATATYAGAATATQRGREGLGQSFCKKG